ncbi:hypothetical protein HDU78_000813 [Chytriomyces hyalinus]|nr:hypothetical protein HDU78_000813 [Chytriomyces hyalinus]
MSSVRRGAKTAKIIRPIAKKTGDNFEGAWTTLSTAIVQIHSKNASSLSFEELYRSAYNLVLNKNGDKLYAGVKDLLVTHLSNTASKAVVPLFPTCSAATGTNSVLTRESLENESNSAAAKMVKDAIAAGLPNGVASFTGGDEFLKLLKSVWDHHVTCMIMVRDILLYMDRVYVPTAKKPFVYDLGLDLFRDVILHNTVHPIREKLIETLMNQILLDREGDVVDKFAVKSMTDMLLSLSNANARVGSGSMSQSTMSIYELDFERPFLATSGAFYTLEAAHLLATCDARGFLLKIENRLLEEEERVKAYLSSSTGPKLRAVLESVLIADKVEELVYMENSGLVVMLSNNHTQDIARMYRLFSRVESGHATMRKCITAEIQDEGRKINELYGGLAKPTPSSPSGAQGSLAAAASTSPNPIQWVQEMLSIKTRFDGFISSCFDQDKKFVNCVNDALASVVNLNPQSPEYLSLFIDENLKKGGQKGKYEADIDAILDNTITLFRLLVYKDVFERYYKQHLARRLLFGKSLSEDAEKGFIGKLKIECGSAFTQKLEGMFTDMKVSEDVMSSFKALPSSVSNSDQSAIDLNVKVLTTTLWPTFPNHPVTYPPQLQSLLSRFETYYMSARHSGRKLTWQSTLGNMDLRANFPKGRKEINVSLIGSILLLSCFNDSDSSESAAAIPFSTIADTTGIPAPELKRALQSLSLGKHKILLKSSKGKDVDENRDTFKFNLSFSSPLAKIKILTISATSTAASASNSEANAEREGTFSKIEDERKHQIEAAIVRTMKSRKRMDHANLVVEVTEQLKSRFMPHPSMIKTRIEGLIERDYLERDAKDRRMYMYLA